MDLHFFQCSACKQTAVTIARAVRGRLWRCISCRTPMKHLWVEPIRSARDEQWAAYGVVYNPGLTTCETCGVKLSRDTKIDLAGVGLFCSPSCAAPAVARHEAALMPKEATR